MLFMLSGALMALGVLMLVRRATPRHEIDEPRPAMPAAVARAAPVPHPVGVPRLPPPAPALIADPNVSTPPPTVLDGRLPTVQRVDDHAAVPADEAIGPRSDEGATCRELDATASALCQIVGQMISDLGPESAIAPVLTEDLASIDLVLRAQGLRADLAAGRWAAARPVLDSVIADLQRIRTLARIESERMLALVPREPRLPETYEDACEALGVSTASEIKVIKKVVDALRLTWHPDLAPDDAERVQREIRIKQINAAWDVVQARARASA